MERFVQVTKDKNWQPSKWTVTAVPRRVVLDFLLMFCTMCITQSRQLGLCQLWVQSQTYWCLNYLVSFELFLSLVFPVEGFTQNKYKKLHTKIKEPLPLNPKVFCSWVLSCPKMDSKRKSSYIWNIKWADHSCTQTQTHAMLCVHTIHWDRSTWGREESQTLLCSEAHPWNIYDSPRSLLHSSRARAYPSPYLWTGQYKQLQQSAKSLQGSTFSSTRSRYRANKQQSPLRKCL